MKAYLHVASGKTFSGELAAPLEEKVSGEIVFFTGMTGYQEVLTDPSYKNQIIVFTYPLIGNYGINENDFESKRPHVEAVVVYEASREGFHYGAKYSLAEYLQHWNIPLLTHVDTRALVKEIRTAGTMMAELSLSPISAVGGVEAVFPVRAVSTRTIETYGEGGPHLVLVDFGYKKSILQSLLARGCRVTVVPHDTAPEAIDALKPDGLVLSNGPGDPKQLRHQLPAIRQLIDRYPTLAICLGHQLVALAYGADTEKLRFGHRGANQPVWDAVKQNVMMTSQNHSYVVKEGSLVGKPFDIRFINVNDGSVEGIVHRHKPILSVQYHPEAHPGPHDTGYIFDEFLQTVFKGENVYA
ncbi:MULTISPECIES: carbamoyl phosphate synthase small subunit [Geobacillus]|uniref:Carbamoyl phosphate synthase small chain n=1 Tax=Geobacillus stearothermophilus TaxID=1422 RepID=A0A150MJH2_GEOSE|nr:MULTISPECIES: carbamoyl phosphate synthase small subunit [Geobacillus]KMY61976.1 carbamoyl phosphate synthase small subunit [Geobacillus stearothermophilus]KOR94172.1 carbamoyl phosphate synthase small subunit [Geobacillus stearothermophilus ATCC 12980]KYD24465.1 Carbamoyl-phosphate synthase small chain [Geobacillus stearothermophilus]MBR2517134.1 carbamoyl phosphate synthase small subunit [Geobacillus sp.]MED3665044.1 carbamoyl phosphate synthase small subunit [Geobacillus stearothermophil